MKPVNGKQVIISIRFANFLIDRGHRLVKILKGKKEGRDRSFLFEWTPRLKEDMDRYTKIVAKERQGSKTE